MGIKKQRKNIEHQLAYTYICKDSRYIVLVGLANVQEQQIRNRSQQT